MHEYAPTTIGERDTQAPTGRGQPDQIVHREQDRAALTDNHRDGVHGLREVVPGSVDIVPRRTSGRRSVSIGHVHHVGLELDETVPEGGERPELIVRQSASYFGGSVSA